MKKAVIFIMDGAGDRAIKELGHLTPLEAACTPNLDYIARNGINGLMYTVGPGIIPGSDTSHMSLFGYDPKKCYPGRGPLEALGEGVDLKPGDVAFRVNFATVDDSMRIIDRRAGRIESGTHELAKLIDGIEIDGIKIIFKPSVQHRAVLVLRGDDLSDKVSDSDPHHEGVPVRKVVPLDNTPEAKRTAEILNKLMRIAYEKFNKAEINAKRREKGLLPANMILIRGAGMLRQIEPIEKKYGIKGAIVSGVAIVRGVGRLLGMDAPKVKGATGDPRTNIGAKIDTVINLLRDHEIVLVNIKAPDVFGHDGNFIGKMKFIEKIDRHLRRLIDYVIENDIYMIVSSDHSTPCSKRDHSSDPVPLAAIGPDVRMDSVEKFGERFAALGGLGTITGMGLFGTILDWIDKAEKFGA